MTPTTQTRHPWRATARTVLAALVGALSLVPTVATTTGLDTVPAVTQLIVVAGVITRILAVPGVDQWLRQFLPWLASAPASDVQPRI
jgi:hypothetical protein